MKLVYPKEEVCITCRLCEIGCIVEHSKTKDILKAFLSEYPRPVSRILVEENGGLSFAQNCRHCEEPLCIEACSNNALWKDEETGIVYLDEKRCMFCWMCIGVCPYGAVKQRIDEKNKIRNAVKCDLCPEREIPACVEICPNSALFFENRGVKNWR